MLKKSNRNKGDEIIKRIDLNRGQYNEATLVDKVCTDAEKKSYHNKEKFASTKYRQSFIDRLACYCKFEYDPVAKKVNIKEVFTYPKTQAEVKVHNDIYQYLTPLILDKVINSEEGRWTIFNIQDIARDCYMCNKNYSTVKSNQSAVEKDLHIPQFTTLEFFNKADDRIDDYIRRCVKYLKEMNCVIFDEIHIICKIIEDYDTSFDEETKTNEIYQYRTNKRYEATKEEVDLYASLVEIASKKAGVRNNCDKRYGKTAIKYNAELSKLLKAHNIKYVCRGFRLHRVDTSRCKEILDSFSDKPINQYRKEIGVLLKNVMDGNAEKRVKKSGRADKFYLENFKDLSEITLLYGAPDIRPRLPSAKTQQERLQQEAENTAVKIFERNE